MGVDKITIKTGDKVTVEYEGTLDDGTVFDSSKRHDKSLEFVAGAGQVIKGFDDAVIGMEKGDQKDITLQPSDAYGEYNPELVRTLPREKFPKEELKSGMRFLISLPDGRQIPAKIIEVTDETVAIDLNHPLSGKTLHFKVRVVDVSS